MKKRSCDGCRALDNVNFSCLLGHEIDVSFSFPHHIPIVKPKHECPKPKTRNEFSDLTIDRR